MSHAAFRSMLLYIYGGAVHVPEELAVELLGLADRYLLSGLKQLCGFTLEKMVGVDTVARIIQAAERWDSPEASSRRAAWSTSSRIMRPSSPTPYLRSSPPRRSCSSKLRAPPRRLSGRLW